MMLVLEMDYTNKHWLFAYEVLNKLTLYKEFVKLNVVLGDLNHPAFFGSHLSI